MSAYSFIIDGMRWSYSRIHCYENCPREFYMCYVEPMPKENNAFAQYGTWGHACLEDYYNGKISILEIGEKFKNGYDENVTLKFPKLFKTDLGKAYREAGEEYFEVFTDPFEGYEVLGVEQEINITVCGHSFTGYIDLLMRDPDGNLVICDHKSKNGFKSKKERRDYLNQLYLYSIYVHEKYGEYPTHLIFNMFRAHKLDVTEFSIEELNATIKWFVSTIEKIRNDEIFEDKIATYYHERDKSLSEYKGDDFYCTALCNMRKQCERAKTQKGRRKK